MRDKKIGILMIHGFSATPNQFKELAEFFSKKGFFVSTPLIAGHGGDPDELILATQQDWKNSIKKSYLELKSNADKIFIIGNSFGANLAFWLASEFKNEPAGIITLGAPIWLKYHKYILLRLYTYGLIKKYYRKPRRVYKNFLAFLGSLFTSKNRELPWAPILDMSDMNAIPTKSLRRFIDFIKKETVPNLKMVKSPVFIVHSSSDTVVLPKSAEFIYNNIGSEIKEIFWFPSNRHVVMYDEQREKIFEKINTFIEHLI